MFDTNVAHGWSSEINRITDQLRASERESDNLRSLNDEQLVRVYNLETKVSMMFDDKN